MALACPDDDDDQIDDEGGGQGDHEDDQGHLALLIKDNQGPGRGVGSQF